MPSPAHNTRRTHQTPTLAASVAGAIVLALSSVSSTASALPDPKPHPGVRVRHVALPDDVTLLDWTWSGDAIFTFEGSGDDRALKRMRIQGDRLIEDATWPSPTGHQPIIIGKHQLAYFDDQRTLTIIDSRTGGPKRSLEISAARPNEETGGIGQAVFSNHAIFFHATHAHSDTPRPRLFRITLDPLAIHTLGTGYYPRPGPGGSVYFVDHKHGFALMRRRPGSDGALDPPEKISPLECYAPAPLPHRPQIVIQNGFDPARILLIDDQGRVIRILSGDAHLSVWPQVSPSGKFVAFTTMDDWEEEAKTVHIVDMKGHELHTTSIGDHPVSAAYRWDPTKERITVFTMIKSGGKALTIISVGL